MDDKEKVIFIGFPGVLQEISLVRTGLLDYFVKKGYNLVVIVNDMNQKSRLEHYFAKEKIRIEICDSDGEKITIPEKAIRYILFLKYLRKVPHYKAKALRQKWERTVLRRLFLGFAVRCAALVPENLLLFVLNRSFSKHELDALFAAYKPDLLVLSWIGTEYTSDLLIRSAKKFGCKNISIDCSWDIMESAVWIPILDKWLVWNEAMKNEAIRLHGYHPDHVGIIGPLRCDFYRKRELLLERGVFFGKYNFRPEYKLVTLVLNSAGAVDFYIDIINLILKNAPDDKPIQLVIRLAPGMSLDDFKGFTGLPFVHIDPGFDYIGGNSVVSEAEIVSLTNLLAHTDVLISVLSTLILESCYFDRPNISLALSPVKHLYERDFIQSLFVYNGVKIVYNENELIDALNAYLLDPAADREGRRDIVNNLCFGADGRAGERAIGEIENLLSGASNSSDK